MRDIFDYFINEDAYGDVDVCGALSRLSKAVRCETISDYPKEGSFEELHEIIRENYPFVMKNGSCEILRNSMLITINGTDPNLLPALFMSHLDVVPIAEGTEKDWNYPPFSGEIAEGYIWGRGTQDIKVQVFGVLEAVEYLLSKGAVFKRTVYLAFGDDEETNNTGAKMIADLLEERGVRLEFLLDEGGGTVKDGANFGAPGTDISNICLMEKGYADLELFVESKGGHSSNPFGGTSLAILSKAISNICDNPFPAKANPILLKAFGELKEDITREPFRTFAENDFSDKDALAKACLQSRELFPYVTTTIAPTMIEGSSSACNVMPQNMRAVINFRMDAETTPEQVMEHCKNVICDERVHLRFLQSNPASIVSRTESFGYETLKSTLEMFFGDVKFIPLAVTGATDARQYENICDVCLRFSPFFVSEEDASGMHGTNERMSVRSFAHGIRVLIRFMERTLM